MQKSKPFRMYMPKKIVNIINEIPGVNKQRMYVLLNSIINYSAIHNDKEFICINNANFENKYKFIPANLITTLVKNNILISDGIYLAGKKSYHYKINDELIDELVLIEILPNTKEFELVNTKLRNEKKNYHLLSPHLRAMQKKFNRLMVDNEIAKEILANDEELNSNPKKMLFNKNAILKMSDKRTRSFSRNTTNYRLDTNLTKIKSSLRYSIIGDFTSLDMKNAQISFLAMLLNEIFNENNESKIISNLQLLSLKEKDKKDMVYIISSFFSTANFIKTFGKTAFQNISKIPESNKYSFLRKLSSFFDNCIKGEFYDKLVKANNNLYTRSEIKKFMMHVLFSRTRTEKNRIPYYNSKKVFSKSYYEIMQILNILNKKNNKTLAIYLQTIESTLFIDILCKNLFDNGIIPTYTIHDSIVVETHEAERTKQIIEKTFLDIFGYLPKFGIEKTGTANYKPTQLTSSIKVA